MLPSGSLLPFRNRKEIIIFMSILVFLVFIVLVGILLATPGKIGWLYSNMPGGTTPICDVSPFLTWASNGIYVCILVIAVVTGCIALLQLKSVRLQGETQVILHVFGYLYSDDFREGKKTVYRKLKYYQLDQLNEQDTDKIDKLLQIYNNISLLILNKHIQKDELPTMFYANAVKMQELCRGYIEERRDKSSSEYYAQHFMDLEAEEYLNPASHQENFITYFVFLCLLFSLSMCALFLLLH